MMILNQPLAALPARKATSGLHWLLFVLVAGLIVIAHGCHGNDVDHELFAPDSVQASAE